MKLYKCTKCGEVVEVLEDKCDSLTCCGTPMEEIKVGREEASLEKHIPFCEVQGDSVYVRVGEKEHPMTEEHRIMWVAAEYSDSVVKYFYKAGDKPEAYFDYEKGMKVYAYCNLHGLWKKEL